ncbi:MAG: hypothetical protein LQ341_005289, partial [Variospora aurantia]
TTGENHSGGRTNGTENEGLASGRWEMGDGSQQQGAGAGAVQAGNFHSTLLVWQRPIGKKDGIR